MTRKGLVRDFYGDLEELCDACHGFGEYEIEHPGRATEATGGQAFDIEIVKCEHCQGSGVAPDPGDTK